MIEKKDFMILASMAFSFYFANKGNTSDPFAGKKDKIGPWRSHFI
jgi:hypothetical protein